jgi:hypothetical protein
MIPNYREADRFDMDGPRKERRCLMCATQFMSEWSGERICRKCKDRAVWRAGVKF